MSIFAEHGAPAEADAPPAACTITAHTPAEIVLGASAQAYSIPITGCDGVTLSAGIDVLGNGNSIHDSLYYAGPNTADVMTLYPGLGDGAQKYILQLSSSYAYAASTCYLSDGTPYSCTQAYTVSLATSAPMDARYRSASTLAGKRTGNATTLTGQIFQYSPMARQLVPYRSAVRVERWNGAAWKMIGTAYPNGKAQFSFTRVDAKHYRYRVHISDSATVWGGISRSLAF